MDPNQYEPSPRDPGRYAPAAWEEPAPLERVRTVPVGTRGARTGGRLRGARAVAVVALCAVSAAAGAGAAISTRADGALGAGATPATASAVSAAGTAAPTATPPAPAAITGDQESIIVGVVERVGPAVVTIQVGGAPAGANGPGVRMAEP